jgi:hypothetical protein
MANFFGNLALEEWVALAYRDCGLGGDFRDNS